MENVIAPLIQQPPHFGCDAACLQLWKCAYGSLKIARVIRGLNEPTDPETSFETDEGTNRFHEGHISPSRRTDPWWITNLSIARPIVDLPQPLSPTKPAFRPA